MEASLVDEFAPISVDDLSLAPPAVVSARFVSDDQSGGPQLRFHLMDSLEAFLHLDLRGAQLFRLGPVELLCVVEESRTNDAEKTCARAFRIRLTTEVESKAFHSAFKHWKQRLIGAKTGYLEDKQGLAPISKFDDKIEAASASMYFHYYGQLRHQQTILEDHVMTGTYYTAIITNHVDFQGRVVVEVGAGTGILSLFAAQAGAKHVYAIEASEMAEHACMLIAGNPPLGQRITVIKGKVEEVELPEEVDILISEPMGTLLVNGRMLESYVIARDRFLVSNGKMFPSAGRICMAPFSDEHLFVEIANKALFWQQQNYYGVDLTSLYGSFFKGYFSKPVLGAFDQRILISPAIFYTLDFTSIKEEELYEINVPLNFVASVGAMLHGLACWFDVLFNGSSVQSWLNTAPGAPTTHWYQLLCVLPQPMYVMAEQEITGHLHLVAHHGQSYTINLSMSAKMWGPGACQGGILQTSSCSLDLQNPYCHISQFYAVPHEQELLNQFTRSQEASLKSMNESDSSNSMNEFDPSITMRSPNSIQDMLDSFVALDNPETSLDL
ncbi:probable histone-arginine methyltransferase CARM1 [Elaeis guineensis]|uniref:type I protein arginine methyltransferase n=1 Tax=Elaeis guineensis var. tenera TaxID=51953 RepID=A0A6I9QST8_ELAGV|nr:probable histone-arginine methyltransferase CARM1 [Elaeis guineensis]